MKIITREMETITLLGKIKFVQGGSGVKDVWEAANCHFDEIKTLAKKTREGKVLGVWGAMSDRSMSFLPWENQLSEGFYMAGLECEHDVTASEGWSKWTLPAFRCLYVQVQNNYPDVMKHILREYMPLHQQTLVGAIQEFYDPAENGQLYLLFPIEKR